MNRLILTPIVVLWVALTAQAQFYNNGLITNNGNVITNSQLPWVTAANGVYNGTGTNGVFEHRGPSAQTFTNNGTYSATAGHTDRFSGPGGSAGTQEIAGNRQPQFHNLHLNNGSSGVINITNTAGVLVSNQVTFANGITTTVRTNPTAGALRLGVGATYTGGTTDAQHVNGYVTKTGNTAFTFPVGSGTDVRTLAMSAPGAATDQYSVAWIAGDPTTTSDPTGTPALHPTASRDAAAINRVSPAGQWDWVAASGTGAGLAISVSIPDMTAFASAISLRLVGWNGTRWIDLSTGAKPYLSGTSYASGNTANSTLDGTLVAGITAIGIGEFPSGFRLSGTVFYDGNGLTDGRVDRNGNGPTPLNGTDFDPLTTGAQALYTTLVNSNGTAVTTVPVTSGGTFSFSSVAPGTYSAVLSTNPAGSTVSVLPNNFMNTGERLGFGGGNDGTPNGILTGITIAAGFPGGSFDNIVNFGINRRPVAKSTQVPPQPTPGPGVQIPVPETAFGGIDLEDGPFPTPENSTYSYDLRGREVTLRPATGGTVYYLGNPVSASLAIPGFEPDRVTVSAANAQTTSVSFPYTIRDQAGFASAISSINLPFTGPAPSISGTVFDDGNGRRDGIVNGTPINGTAVPPINGAPVPLYVSLVQNLAQGGTALAATVPVTATGTYSFPNLPINTSYNIILTTNPDGTTSVPSLPTDWASTADFYDGLYDPLGDGTIGLFVRTTPVVNANFGINRRPQVSSATDVVRLNPAGAVPVSASLLVGSDFEDGPYPNNMLGRTVSLSAATGGTLYHNGQQISTVAGFVNGFNPSGLTVDPTAPGATTVSFAYQIEDNAGVLSAPGIISVPFVGPTVSLSGRVFDDGNGLTDNLVNQTGNGPNPLNGTDFDPAVAGSQGLFATLVSNTGTALGTVPVTATGTYSFTGVSAGTYSVVLGTNLAGGTTPSLPNTWVNTGEKLGTGTGSDGTPNGILTGVVVGTTAVGEANFGINKRPTGATASVPTQPNPGGNVQVPIPATAFTGTDLEDGPYANNLTGREVTLTPASGGTLYYNSTPVSTTTAVASFDPTKVTIDPTATQATTVQFTYLLRDNAGTASNPVATPSFITVSFTGDPITISGTVFDDANGRTDNTVNGVAINGTAVPPITGAPVPLYASLALEATLIATVPVTAAGTYSFTNVVGNRAYNVVLTTNPAGDVITSTLPTGWVNTGAFVGTGPGNTGTFPGVLGVSVGNSSISNANFGIDRRPVGATVTLTPRSNPGGNVQSPISATAFTATDLEDGLYPNNLTGRAVTLSAATGGTLYYNSTPVSTSLAITSFDPTKVSLDPTALGTTTATFTYSLSDNAGVASLPATVTVPFQPTFGVAGRVVNDGNGLTDGLVSQTGNNPINGTDIDPQATGNQPLYAVLIRNQGAGARVGGSSALAAGDEIVAVQPISPTGSYAFTDLPDFDYSVGLSTDPAGSLNSSLPQGWVSTGEQVGNGPGSDGQPNGQIYVGNYTDYVSDANFGIDKRPVVNSIALAPQGNPGGSNRAPIPARAFTGSDLEDGPYSNNLLGRRVTLNPAVGGRLYYNDAPVNAPLDVDEFDPDDVDVDPDEEGESFVAFSYAVNDNAGVASEPASVTQPFTASFSIAGRVFDDGNGLTDNTVNQISQGNTPLSGTDIDPQVAGNQPIYAVLFRLPGEELIATVAVTRTGTYAFTGVPAGAYAVALDNNPAGNLGQLWPGWASTGEFVGTGPGSDGNPDGILTDIQVNNANVVNANFGINKRPQAASSTLAAELNPGGNSRVEISPRTFSATDLEDGAYPNGLLFRRVTLNPATGGRLYYKDALVSAPLEIDSFDDDEVEVDPDAEGETFVAFSYSTKDNAGVASEPASVTQPFGARYRISGRVFDDGNGLTDNTVNQIGQGPNPLRGTDIDPQVTGDQPIYAVLFRLPGGEIVTTVAVTNTGTYSFMEVPAGTYAVALDNAPAGNLGQLWPGWASTGEFLGTGPGSDGNPDGILTDITLTNANIVNANFGINKRPLAATRTLAAQPNPGGNEQVVISATAFSATDLEDGTYPNNLTGRRVQLSAATDGTLYYDGAAITLNLDIANFDPTKLAVDPTAVASTTVTLQYRVYDDAGVPSESAELNLPFQPTYTVSGRVFNDGNGLTDNIVNQTGLGPNPLNGTDIDPQVADPQPIYVVLSDNFDFPQILRSVPVTAAGTYSFTGLLPGTYSLLVSAQQSRFQAYVPFWQSTGEFVGTGPGSDGNPDGILTNIQVNNANVVEANFGLNKISRANDATLPEQPNPGVNVQVSVSATAFSGTDLEDGIYPNNLTGRRVDLYELGQGTVYYDGNLVSGVLTAERFDPTKVTVDPIASEATTVTFGYSVYDDAGQFSEPAQITVPFTAPSFSLSGRVVNDGNGLSDNRVNQSGNGPNPLNGTDIDPEANGQQPIYALLFRRDGANEPVIATTAVTVTGSYTFTSLSAGTYAVALSTDSTGATIGSLPTGWFSTSEQLGDVPGSDGSPDGRLSGIEITRTSITDANFGINKQPRGADVTLANQPNPGGTVQVPVPATTFTGSDLEDGTYPNNLTGRAVVLNPAAGGTLYYNNTPVSANAAITSFDPTKVSLDPTAPGSTTASFTYSVQDNVGIASPPAQIRLVFQPAFSITGRVFDDGNGMTDGLVNQFGNGPNPLDGTDIDPRVPGKQPIYVVLYDDLEFPQVLRSAPVTSNGTYTFTDIPAGTYSFILTNTPELTQQLVPGWAYTGEHVGNGPGDDGRPGDGFLEAVTVTNANIADVNFGIDKRPQGEDFTLDEQPNPGSLRAPIEARAFNATDLEDVAFGSYPDNLRNRRVHLFSAEPLGTLYYEGRVVRGDTNFVVDRFDPTQVSVTPADPGATNVLVYYAVYDNAGIESEPIVVRMPFTDEPAYSLSGRVFNDGNGLTDNLVNQIGNGPNPLDGTDIDPQVAGQQPIYALLLREVAGRQEIAASSAVTTTGTYSFAGLPGGAYRVALGTDTTADRIATLPAGWNFTGKQLSTGPASASTTQSARLDVVINNASVSNANFGIDKRPVGAAVMLAEQPNPRDTIQVPLNAFTGTDLEDGTYPVGLTGRRVELAFNSSGTFYYRGNRLPDNPFFPVNAGSFDPTLLTVRPTAPDSTTVTFTYAVFDDAGVASPRVTVTLPFTAPENRIAGHVFNDGNGLADNLVNQEGDGPDPLDGADIDPLEPGNQPLFAVLAYEENGVRRIVDVEPVDNAGAYEFDELPADFEESRNAYSVFISNDPTGVVQALPQGWAYTGERLGAGAGGDGQPDGRVYFANVANNYEYNDVNFGIDRIPEALSITLPAQRNPGSGVQVAVPTTAFVASDLEDGDYADNLTGQEVVLSNITGGTLYYDGQEVVIREGILRFDPTRIRVAPTSDGETSVRFDYSVYDDADVLSQPATVTLPFTANPLTLSGRVVDDGNGLTDNRVNQTGQGPNPLNGTDIDGTLTGNQALFATLVSSTGASLTTVAVSTNGTYSFGGLTADTYSVVLSTNEPGSLVSALPANWVSTGEQLGTGAGSDGTVDGILTGIVVGNTSLGDANFGIDQRPAGADVRLASQDNPGGTVQVPVPATAFTGTDLEDGTYPNNLTGRAVTLSTATGGTLYYNSVPLNTTLAIARFDPTKVTLDPTAQDSTTVSFTYQVRDSAGVSSAPATITLPFGSPTVSISGNVLNDGNGLRDDLVNGPGINGPTLPVYVSLLDGARLIETVSVNVSGFFNFLSVQANKAYKLILNTLSGGSQTPSLPEKWVNTGESLPEANQTLSAPKSGATVSQQQRLNRVDDAADGVIEIQVQTSGVSDVIFGIEQRPAGANVTLAAQSNPGGTVQASVSATAFTGTDLEDGLYPGNLAGRAVNLNPATGGTLYYNSTPISTSLAITGFDPTKVTLDPAAAGSTTTSFTYQVQDNAGLSSPPATITLPFTGPAAQLSGNVFNDANGLTDNLVNGTGANGPALPLYVSLVNSGVVATVPVTDAGAYSFTGVGSGTYSVVLTTNSGGSATASLPANWVSTGEQLGTGPGSDGTPNGLLTGIRVGTSDVAAANFGIDRKPVVASGAMPPLSNPGGTNRSTVFASVFAGSDPEDGTYANNLSGREVTLTAAAGGTLYYNGSPVSGAGVITNFDPARVTLDPTAQKETVVTFAVAVKDNAGVLSDPKPITVPFSDDQDEEDENDDPDEDDGNEDPDDDDDGDNDDDGQRDDRVRLPTNTFTPIIPTIRLPLPIGVPPIPLIGILITVFPINAISIIINGTVYTRDTFPPEGVIVRTNEDGDLEDDLVIEPEDPTKPVPIPFVGVGPTGTPVTSPGNTNAQPATLINNGPLSCTNTTVTLTAGGTGTYRFSAGATPVAGGNTATVTGAGTYYVIVTGPNGYQARAATIVTADQSVPAATLTASGPLSCSTTSVTLTAGGVGTYRFSAGATQIAGGNTATVTQAGIYEVTVTAANGCRATASVRVVADQSVPAATLINNGPLSCTNTTVTLTAGGTGTYRFSAGATQIGTGPTATVTEAGVYSVTVTATNGCSATAQTTVNSTSDAPLRIINQPVSSSIVTVGATVTASVSVTGTGPVGYQWYKDGATPVVGQTSAVLNLPNVQRSDEGRYVVVVSGPCNSGATPGLPGSLTSTAFTLTVNPNSLTLSVVATPDTLLTTETTRLTATVLGGTAPYSYSFSGPGTITATGNTATVASLSAGVQTFTVVARDATTPTSQTVSTTVSVTVSEPNTPPRATINLSQTAIVNEDFSYEVSAFTDAETPNSLTYTARISPANGLSFDPATRELSGTPLVVGVSSVTITATDPGSLTASTTFLIVVRQPQSTTGLVISQIYGSGGEPGAAYRNDFVELFNRSDATIDVSGWSVQYANATGAAWQSTPLTGSIPAGGYYLVQGAAGSSTAVTTSLPTPDATGTINVSETAGKVALVKVSTALSGTCPTGTAIVDFVGYGTANCYEGPGAALGSPTGMMAYFRKVNGCTDTDDNTADFAVSAVLPRNSASPVNVCGAVTSLSLTVSASPSTLLTTGTTTLSARVAGGTSPYSYTFSGPGTISQTPASNTATVTSLTAGVQTFTVVVSDASTPASQTISATVSVTVTNPVPVNTPPVATTNASQTATVGVAFAYTVNAFTDAQTPNSLTYTASINPANGLSFDPATRLISGTPVQAGLVSVTVTATDSGSLSASTNFSITVIPTPAVTSLSLTVSASPATLLTTGTTTLSATVTGGTGPYSYTFVGPGTISQSPANNTASVSGLTAGVQTFTVVAGDATLPLSQTVSATVSVTVTAPLPVNTAPVATTNASQTAIVGQPFAYTVAAFTDAETPNSLTYTASLNPANGLTFNPATRVISGVPGTTGVSSVTITATDSGSLSASTSFSISVQPVPVVVPPLTLTLTASPTTLLTTGTTTLSATVSGGTSPYSYTFSATSGLAIFNGTSANNTVIVSGLTAGVRTFRVLVVDATLPISQTITAFVSVTVTDPAPVNTAPVATTNVSQTATVGRTFSYTVNAFTDAETPNSLTYSATLDPANGLSFDPATRVISGLPDEAEPVSVTITATDPGGLSASTSFSISVGPRIVGNTPLRVTLTASPTTLLTSGSTVLRATASGGNPGPPPSAYSYTFSGPGEFTTSRPDEVTVSNLPAGVQTFTVVVSDASTPVSQTNSATVSVTVTEANTAPTVANVIPPQSATVGQAFSYVIPAATFTDAQTPNALSLSVSGLPQGISFTSPATLSGTPSVSGVSSVTVTATDPAGLSVSTTFSLTVNPAGTTPNPTAPFAITGVTTLSCTPVGNQISLSFTPQYAGATGQPISFSVANELAPTTNPGPYTLRLFADNPVITLKATQTGTAGEASFAYNWLAACNSQVPGNTAPTVANPIPAQSATVGQAFSYSIPANTFSDAQTPNALVLSVSGLPQGISFTSPATLSGTPSLSGVSSVTVTATDPAGLSVSTTFSLTVNPAGTTPNPTVPFAITGVTTLSCTPVGNQISLSFTPQYAGLSGQPISFSVANELAPTTNPGPYTLRLFADNPVITLKATQTGTAGEASFAYNWLAACNSQVPGNTAPTVANPIPAQSATVGQAFSYVIPAATFTDAQTPNALSLSVSGLPQGISFTSPATLSGTPSVSGVSSVTVTATDPAGLSVSTTFSLTVNPAGTTPNPTAPFAITGVTTLSCTPVGNQISLSFTPQYAGATGQPISFSVANELAPTTNPGPYTLRLFADNPVITLKATQTGTAGEATFSYNWLAACNSQVPGNTAPTVANPIPAQSATVGQVFSYSIPARTFTDAQTPNALVLSVSGLPQGISFTSPATLSGTPSVSGVSNVTVTATDPAGLSVSTTFSLTVNPAGTTPTPTAPFAITGVSTISCTPVGNQISLSFTPQYAGATGQPISFSVANELAPTNNPGPYTLRLFADNPVITLKATQTGTAGEASFAYNWLAACQSGARLKSESEPELEVVVLGNPVVGSEVTVDVRRARGQPLRLQLSNLQGRAVSERIIEQAGSVERVTLDLGNESAGQLLLRVSTPTRSRTVKVLKVD